MPKEKTRSAPKRKTRLEEAAKPSWRRYLRGLSVDESEFERQYSRSRRLVAIRTHLSNLTAEDLADVIVDELGARRGDATTQAHAERPIDRAADTAIFASLGVGMSERYERLAQKIEDVATLDVSSVSAKYIGISELVMSVEPLRVQIAKQRRRIDRHESHDRRAASAKHIGERERNLAAFLLDTLEAEGIGYKRDIDALIKILRHPKWGLARRTAEIAIANGTIAVNSKRGREELVRRVNRVLREADAPCTASE